MEKSWEKPVVVFYKEREKPREKKAMVAIKARKIVVSKQADNELKGSIEEFFPLIGDFEYPFTPEGKTDNYVLCWFDDTEDDFTTAFRRLTGVTFPLGIQCEINEKGKKVCNTTFTAKQGKLE